jgi:hypothetical protein
MATQAEVDRLKKEAADAEAAVRRLDSQLSDLTDTEERLFEEISDLERLSPNVLPEARQRFDTRLEGLRTQLADTLAQEKAVKTERQDAAQKAAQARFRAGQAEAALVSSQQQQQTQKKANDDAGSPAVSAGGTVQNAQTARDDKANPVLPGPPPDTVPPQTNAAPTPTAADGTTTEGDNAPVRPITATQGTSSQQPDNVGVLDQPAPSAVTPPGSGTSPSPAGTEITANDRPGVGAANDDQRGGNSPNSQSNSVRNRLDELYGGVGNAIVAQDNVLDGFASYTYSLSWYLMDPAAYQRLINQQKKDLNGYYLLVQSAGIGQNTGQSITDAQTLPFERQNPQSIPGSAARSPFFPLDYYIDDFETEVMYAAGSESQSAATFSNIRFTLTEPNGLTLLPNLYRAVENLIQAGGQLYATTDRVNYAAAMFCMVIRFYGYDENGVLQAPVTNARNNTDSRAVVEKFIPFTLSKVDFSVGSRLVEYKIEGATPDVSTGLSTNRGSIPQDFDFSGSTVQDILVGAVTQVNVTAKQPDSARPRPAEQADVRRVDNQIDANQKFEKEQAQSSIVAGVDVTDSLYNGTGADVTKPASTAPAKANAAPKPTTKTVGTGLIAALNNFQQQLVKKGKIEHPDVYDIKFGDNIIASATAAPPGGLNKNRAGGTPSTTAAEQKLGEKSSVNPSVRLRSVRAGTQIIQFIDEVVRNSSYIIDQQSVIYNEKTKRYEKNGKPAQQFAWFQVTVVAEPGPYDRKRNDYSYKMTFYVTPYEVPMVSEYFSPSGFRGVHKVYNYWFTGQNSQVLQFEQSFDKLWTQVLTADTNITEANQQQRKQMNSREQWMRHYYSASGQNRQGGEGKTFEGGANAADFLYGPNYGTINLNIIGDPAWIPNAQYGYSLTQFTASPFWPDGTINNTASVPYFEFAWNRPVDYNINTGLMDPGQANYFADREKGVAGLAAESQTYIASKVKCMFKGGRFSQDLEGAWMWDQTINQPKDERKAQTPPAIDRRNENQSAAESARLSRAGTPPAPVRVAGDGSSTARGVQQTLSPPPQTINPSVSQIQSSQAYITARQAGLGAREAYDYAAQQFAQGRAGEAYQPQKIVRES